MIDMALAKKTARELLRANRKSKVSWRKISKHGYRVEGMNVMPGIAAGTICRFAKSKATWMPNEATQKLLGIYKERAPRQKRKTLRERNAEIGISLLSSLHSK